MFKINIYALSILLCLGSSTAMPMQTSSLQDLTQYVIPTVKILAGAACLKYLVSLKVNSQPAKSLLGAVDARYEVSKKNDGFSFSIISSRSGNTPPTGNSSPLRFNVFPIIAGIYLLKSGIQDFRNV